MDRTLLFLSISLTRISQTSYEYHVLSRLILRKTPSFQTISTDLGSCRDLGLGAKLSQDVRRIQLNTPSSLNTGFFFINESRSKYKLSGTTDDGRVIASSLPKDFVAIGAPCSSIASVDTFEGPSEGPQLASSISLANIPECDREVFTVGEPSKEYNFGQQTPERDGEGWSVIMLFCTFSCQNYLEDYLDFLKAKHPKAEVIGGFVGGRENVLFKDGKITRCGGIAAMAIGGNVVYSSQVSRACKKISDVYTIQSLGSYNDDYEGEITKLMSPTEGCLKAGDVARAAVQAHNVRILYCGITKAEENGFQLMDVRGLSREDGIAVAGGTKELRSIGNKVCLFTLDPESSSNDIRLRLAAAKRAASGRSKTVLGAILVSCGARGESLYGKPNVEPTVFSEELGGVGMSGFFAGGEIGPEALAALPYDSDFRGETTMQGFTSVFGVFFVPAFKPTAKVISEAFKGRKINF